MHGKHNNNFRFGTNNPQPFLSKLNLEMMPVPVLEDHNFYIVGTVVTCDTKKVPT